MPYLPYIAYVSYLSYLSYTPNFVQIYESIKIAIAHVRLACWVFRPLVQISA